MSYYSSKLVLFLVLLSGFLKGQESKELSYAGLIERTASDSVTPPQLFQELGRLTALEKNKDSLIWLIDQLLIRVQKYEESLPQLYLLQQSTSWADNIYEDSELALHYNSELVNLCKAEGENIDYYWLTNTLSFRMFLFQQSDQEEMAISLAQEIAERLEIETAPMPKAYGYKQLCLFYERLDDYNRATHFCRKGIAYNEAEGSKFFNNSFYQTLAIIGNRSGMSMDSVIFYRKASVVAAKEEGNEYALRTNYLNLAVDYSKNSLRDSAEKYFALSKTIFVKYPWNQGEIGLALKYAEHLNRFKMHQNAYRIADSIHPLLDSADYEPKIQCYRIKLISRAMLGDIDSLTYYLDQSDSLIFSRFNKERLESHEEMATKYETEKKEAAIALLELKNRSANLQKFLYLAAVLLLLLVGGFLFWKRRKEAEVAELKRLRLEDEKKQAEKRIKELKNELQRSISSALDHQNRNIELQDLVEELNTQVENVEVQSKARVIRSKMSEYSQNETLDDIEYRAREVFPRLYSMLYTNLSGRSKLELIYCVMLVMNYSTEDICRILQKTDKAVKSLRYRIRKKLELSDDQSLSHFLKNHTEWSEE